MDWLSLSFGNSGAISPCVPFLSPIPCMWGCFVNSICVSESSVIRVVIGNAVGACAIHTQSCLTHCDPIDCSPPGSPVHGIFQARVLEWVAISLSKCSWTCCYFIRKWHSLSSTGNCWTFIVCPSLSGRDYLLRASLWYLPPKAWVSNTTVCWQQELKAWILVPQPSTTFTVFGRSLSRLVPQFKFLFYKMGW